MGVEQLADVAARLIHEAGLNTSVTVSTFSDRARPTSITPAQWSTESMRTWAKNEVGGETVGGTDLTISISQLALQRLIHAVAEECAKACESEAAEWDNKWDHEAAVGARFAAARIRALLNQPVEP